MRIIKAQIIKAVAGDFSVRTNSGETFTLKGRGKLKTDKLLVGDMIEFDKGEMVIEKLLPRKNQLIRPPVANVDQALIVVAPIPKPDFLLIDKLIIKFILSNIKPIIVINKLDLCAMGFLSSLVDQYGSICEIILFSALEPKTTQVVLNPVLSEKFSILVGQSAVGKTSIINSLLDTELEVGEMSKIGRGKNTTRHSEIFVLSNGGLIADTPGFSALDLEFSPGDILDCYLEFKPYLNKCRFDNCNHIKENDCAIKQAVKNGEINKERYERFVALFNLAKEKEKK